VLIVDDSAAVRKLLTGSLTLKPEIEVVGSAANGIVALDKVMQLEPELVLLDIDMPELDGVATLHKLRASHPQLPVIMLSEDDEHSVDVAIQARSIGASDHVVKPSLSERGAFEAMVASSLHPKLLAVARARPAVIRVRPSLEAPLIATPATDALFARLSQRPGPGREPLRSVTLPAPARPVSEPPLPRGATLVPAAPQASVLPLHGASLQALLRKPAQVVVIAASTGGPNALAEVLSRLPRQLPVPILVVQHMPPLFTSSLAQRLKIHTELDVRESRGGELLMSGSVYIAPGNRHLEVERSTDGVRTLLSNAAQENSCRPSADVLFRSVARSYGARALAIVLTGMGQDGARGAREIREAGGSVLVQSGPTCVIWGMPRAVEEAGLAEEVVPLSEVAAAILRRVSSGMLPLRSSEPGA
jgi:two-component system chemotaxis response regulator CheB